MPIESRARRALHANLLVACALLACGRVDRAPAAKDVIPERYRFLTQGGVMDTPALRETLPFERIELWSRSPWDLGGVTIVLHRDGSSSVNQTLGGPGSVSAVAYGQLCYLIERIGFESMEPRYDWGGYDAPTTTVKVWRAGSAQPITVEDDGGVGPPDLWTLRAAIVAVAAERR
jgi:hypothetical protein